MPPELEAPRPWNLLGIRGLDLDHELHRTPGPQSAPPAEKKIAVEETVDSENARYVGIWDPVARRKVWVDGRTGNTWVAFSVRVELG